MTLNGKEYVIPELDYNTISELEKHGYNLLLEGAEIGLSTARAFLAICPGVGNRLAAGQILEQHIKANGVEGLKEIFEEIAKALEGSGFLASLAAEQKAKAEMAAKRQKAAKSLPKAGASKAEA